MHFPICVCQWLHSCTSTLLQLFGDNLHELAVHNLEKSSITVFGVVDVAPSVFHLIRSTGPHIGKLSKSAEINNTVAIAQFLKNPPPFMRPLLGRSERCHPKHGGRLRETFRATLPSGRSCGDKFRVPDALCLF